MKAQETEKIQVSVRKQDGYGRTVHPAYTLAMYLRDLQPGILRDLLLDSLKHSVRFGRKKYHER